MGNHLFKHPRVGDHNNITANTAYIATDLTSDTANPIYGSGGFSGAFFDEFDHLLQTDWIAGITIFLLTFVFFIDSFMLNIILDSLTSTEWLEKVKIA